MNRIIWILAVSLLLISGCSQSSRISSRAESIVYGSDLYPMGRYATDGQKLELISSGAHVGIRFNGAQCTILASVSAGWDHNYLQYTLDGEYQRRLKVNKEGVDSLKITASSPGVHTLWIYKATEAHSGPVFIHQVIAYEVSALAIPAAPLIEFIGNSITCGAASDPSEVPCGTGKYLDQHNAYMAYGPRIARAVNANFVLSSVSGIGVYRNWNSDGPTMPEVYTKTDFRANGSRLWDFKTVTPDIVSIALGTNDFSNGDGKKPRLSFDSVAFTAAYVSFVKKVKSIYSDSKIVLLNSPMISGKNNDILVDCLQRVKYQIDEAYPSDKPVTVLLMKTMRPGGCSYHPSVEDHKIIADQLTTFFGTLLKE